MALGVATINFGTYPGSTMASVVVTGETGITATMQLEAKISLTNSGTADHSVDEHRVEQIKISAGAIVAGTGFTIYGEALSRRVYGTWDVDWVYA